MKTVIMSIVLSLSTLAAAETTSVVDFGPGAPTFANLQVESISRNITTIDSRLSNIVSGYVSYNSKKLDLTLHRRINCPPNAMCITLAPAPVLVKLDVVSVKQNRCGTVVTAQTPRNALTRTYEVVTVEEYNGLCPQPHHRRSSQGTVTYSVKGVSSLTKQTETAQIIFLADKFIKALN